jgi:hypothetical protein
VNSPNVFTHRFPNVMMDFDYVQLAHVRVVRGWKARKPARRVKAAFCAG